MIARVRPLIKSEQRYIRFEKREMGPQSMQFTVHSISYKLHSFPYRLYWPMFDLCTHTMLSRFNALFFVKDEQGSAILVRYLDNVTTSLHYLMVILASTLFFVNCFCADRCAERWDARVGRWGGGTVHDALWSWYHVNVQSRLSPTKDPSFYHPDPRSPHMWIISPIPPPQ